MLAQNSFSPKVLVFISKINRPLAPSVGPNIFLLSEFGWFIHCNHVIHVYYSLSWDTESHLPSPLCVIYSAHYQTISSPLIIVNYSLGLKKEYAGEALLVDYRRGFGGLWLTGVIPSGWRLSQPVSRATGTSLRAKRTFIFPLILCVWGFHDKTPVYTVFNWLIPV